MDFSKLAREDYDPAQYATPEDALMQELQGFTDMSRAGGMKQYFGMDGEGGEPVDGDCAECQHGTCSEHMAPEEAEMLASLDMGEG